MSLRSLTLLAVAAVAVGCGESEATPEDLEACQHLSQGPAVNLNAATGYMGSPFVKNDHKRYDIALTDAGGTAGWVSFAVAKDGDYRVYLNEPLVVKAQDVNRAEVAPSSTAAALASCEAVKRLAVFPLKVGTNYFSFEPPGQVAKVGLVIEGGE